MLFINRLLLVGLMSVGISTASTAQAGSQLFTAEWYTKSFGNELVNGAGASAVYSAFGIPQGIQCNPNQPRCPFVSTPTDGASNFDPLGGNQQYALFCTPYTVFGSVRPTKETFHGTAASPSFFPLPPFYRNPGFFTSAGQPRATACTATSTGATPGGKGLVQAGHPITGMWTATTTGTPKGAFGFPAAPATGGSGIRTTGLIGEFNRFYPYIYSYTYATLRNDVGVFGPGLGPGSFNIKYYDGTNPVATIQVKQGAARLYHGSIGLGCLVSTACLVR